MCTLRSGKISRRALLRASLIAAAVGTAQLRLPSVMARVVANLGPLNPPDINGWRLPAGFQSRLVATTGQLVPGTNFTWHVDPDGGAVFPQPDGGWIYVSNSEAPPLLGGVSAVRFDSTGTIVDAYSLLTGSERNCAGGATPWGTWLSCEERDAGKVWECDPAGVLPAAHRPAMGHFRHEAAGADADRRVIYMTEDHSNGGLYRFTPTTWGDLSSGTLQVLAGTVGNLDWIVVPNPTGTNPPPRLQVPTMFVFNGGEGLVYSDESLFFSTRGNDRIWELDTGTLDLSILYDPNNHPTPTLTGVDNIAFAPSGDLIVCEDGGDMELVFVGMDGSIATFGQLTGVSGSEITGAAFDPSGTRLYVSSQRNPGATYEISGPFVSPVLQLPRFETSASEFDFLGPWFTWPHASQSSGSAEVTTSSLASMSVGFTGTAVRVIGQVGPNRASATISIDDVVVAQIDTSAAGYTSQVVLHQTTGLPPGPHLLTVTRTGASGTAIVLDAVEAEAITSTHQTPLERIENTDAAWSYTGPWSTWNHVSQSAGSAAVGGVGAEAALAFTGTTLRVIGQAGPARAISEIIVDGVSMGTVDTFSGMYESQVVLYETANLADGAHQLVVKYVGANPLASGSPVIVLDAVDTVRSGQALIRVEQDHPNWVQSGQWTTWIHESQSGGSATAGRLVGSASSISFTGDTIRWIGQRGPQRAEGSIAVDGQVLAVIDTYDTDWESQQLLFQATNLGPGIHTLTITYSGVNPAAGLSSAVAALIIDAIEVEAVV